MVNARHWERVVGLLEKSTGRVVVGGVAQCDKSQKYVIWQIMYQQET